MNRILDAIYFIKRQGWIQYDPCDKDGKVCAIGGLMLAHGANFSNGSLVGGSDFNAKSFFNDKMILDNYAVDHGYQAFSDLNDRAKSVDSVLVAMREAANG